MLVEIVLDKNKQYHGIDIRRCASEDYVDFIVMVTVDGEDYQQFTVWKMEDEKKNVQTDS